jgi:cell wall-associated NlpC family hydrolase
MKLLACALPLLAGLPSVMSGQVSLSVPRLPHPALRATLGPISLVATLSGHSVALRAAPRRPRPTVRGDSPRTAVRASVSAGRVLATGERYLGTGYTYGGETPGTGFDCSGFVQYIFGRNGVDLPRTSRLQGSTGHVLPLDLASLRPGDLMFFSTGGGTINHVAIYAGGNRILHSSAGRNGVVYDDLSTARGKWYLARHVASRRVL